MKLDTCASGLRILAIDEIDLIAGGEDVGGDVHVWGHRDNRVSLASSGGGLVGYTPGQMTVHDFDTATFQVDVEDTNGNGVLGDSGDGIIITAPSGGYPFNTTVPTYVNGQIGVSAGISLSYVWNQHNDGVQIGVTMPGLVYNGGLSNSADLGGFSWEAANLTGNFDLSQYGVNAISGFGVSYTVQIPWATSYPIEANYQGVTQSGDFDASGRPWWDIWAHSKPVE